MRALRGVLRCDHVRRALTLAALLTSVASPALAQRPAPTSPIDADSVVISSPASSTPFAALALSAQQLRDSIVAFARRQIGTRYHLGGQTPDRGVDCSGLVRYVMAAFSIDVPRTSAAQARYGAEVPRDTAALRPGDLLTFGRKGRVSHVGIYAGNGMFIQASSTKGQVIEVPLLRSGRRIKPWVGVRRLVVAPSDTATVRVAAADTSKHAPNAAAAGANSTALLAPR